MDEAIKLFPFISADPNFVHSLDGHEKLMDYQNSSFPIAV